MSELDELLDLARKEPEKGHVYYDAFLNADLFFPVKRADGQSASWKALGRHEKFFPLFLPAESQKVVPAFDSLERLQSWAGEGALDYVTIRGHQLARLVAADVAIALNLGTPHAYLFTPELLARLRDAMRPIRPS